MLSGNLKLYRLLNVGEEAIRQVLKRPLDEVMADLRKELASDA